MTKQPSGRTSVTAPLAAAMFLLFAAAPAATGQGAEAVTWARANNCASIRAYLTQYPGGRYASEARTALRAKDCPDPEAEARRRAEREAADRVRLENETRDLRDRLAREEAARRAAETRAADEARKRVAAEGAASAVKQKTTASSYDLNLLNTEVRRAVETARAAQIRADAAAARARVAASNARASGVTSPTQGLGVDRYSTGDRYEGNFLANKKSGLGVYYFDASKPSISYEGENLDDRFAGPGIFTWRAGHKYSGDNRNNAADGHGVMVFPDGRRYEGAWTADKRNGYGVLWTATGQVSSQGYWTDGTLTTSLTAPTR